MKSKETASTFHHRLLNDNSEPGQFTVYRTEDLCSVVPLPHSRRDFYKISLVTRGEGNNTVNQKLWLLAEEATGLQFPV